MTDEAAFPKPAVETKDGDSAILKVIEAYVNAGKASRASRKSLEKLGYMLLHFAKSRGQSACAQRAHASFESDFARRAACGASSPPTVVSILTFYCGTVSVFNTLACKTDTYTHIIIQYTMRYKISQL